MLHRIISNAFFFFLKRFSVVLVRSKETSQGSLIILLVPFPPFFSSSPCCYQNLLFEPTSAGIIISMPQLPSPKREATVPTTNPSLCDWLLNQEKEEVTSLSSRSTEGTCSAKEKGVLPLAESVLECLYHRVDSRVDADNNDSDSSPWDHPRKINGGESSGRREGERVNGPPTSDSKELPVLPHVIRDIEFVSRQRASHALQSGDAVNAKEGVSPPFSYSHAVLDTLLYSATTCKKTSHTSSTTPSRKLTQDATSRALLLYLARVDTLHPITVCRAMRWAGENKPLLLALASVMSAKTEMRGDGGGRSGGPARLPGWEEMALQEYRLASSSHGSGGTRHATSGATSETNIDASKRSRGRSPSDVSQELQNHAAALAETCVASLASGAHSSLLLLLQVLDILLVALYTKRRVVGYESETEGKSLRAEEHVVDLPRGAQSGDDEGKKSDDGDARTAFHIAESRLVSAMQILMNYSTATSFVGSALGNLTAHLPTVILPEHLVPVSAKPRDALPSSSTEGKQGEGYCVARDPSLVSLVMDRKKEATLHAGVCRPIRITHDTDITSLLEGNLNSSIDRRPQR